MKSYIEESPSNLKYKQLKCSNPKIKTYSFVYKCLKLFLYILDF